MNYVFSFKRHPLLWLCIGVFFGVAWFVDPIRETALEDDWAYALTVRHLLETGEYRLHDWATANMPFQCYWGGMFAYVLGYSFSSLRISTLILAFGGMICFYFLAIEHDLKPNQAGVVTLGLLASPLFLRFCFNFMTDVPFVSCLIIAMFWYTKAIKQNRFVFMFLGSIAASAAILIRQFGMALTAGMFFLWLFEKNRKHMFLLFLSGLILPIFSGIWQLYAGLIAQNWGITYNVARQTHYFSHFGKLLANGLWRPTALLQYLAFFSLPFVLLAMIDIGAYFFHSNAGFASSEVEYIQKKQGMTLFQFNIGVLTAFGLYLVIGIAYGHVVKQLPVYMPYLLWNFGVLKSVLSGFGRGLLTSFTTIGAILFGRIFVLRYYGDQNWNCLSTDEKLLDLVALFLFLFHLIYIDFGDEYLLGFLPFSLIVVGRHLRNWLSRLWLITIVSCLILMFISSLWVRGLISWKEACWLGGDRLLMKGAKPEQVYGLWEWNSYYKFQNYVDRFRGGDLFGNFFDPWLQEQQQQAIFWIGIFNKPPHDDKWEVIDRIPYENIFLQSRFVYIVQRK